MIRIWYSASLYLQATSILWTFFHLFFFVCFIYSISIFIIRKKNSARFFCKQRHLSSRIGTTILRTKRKMKEGSQIASHRNREFRWQSSAYKPHEVRLMHNWLLLFDGCSFCEHQRSGMSNWVISPLSYQRKIVVGVRRFVRWWIFRVSKWLVAPIQ